MTADINRRALLKRIAAASAAIWLAGRGQPASASHRAEAMPAGPFKPPLPARRLLGYAFGTTNQDVTVFDPATWQPLLTAPLGVTVRWLSNEQTFWDGRSIWTYDFPDNEVRAIAIDPVALHLARSVPAFGTGPAHSLMLMPDRTTAWVNLAGDNRLAVIDLPAGRVIDYVETGEFP
ncbi:MAG: YncE family protein [Dehalococcoidia bacterium]